MGKYGRSERHVGIQMLEIGPACLADQLVRPFRFEAPQFFDDFGDAVRITGKVMRHSKVIPRFAVHGLKTDGFLQRFGGLGMVSQARMS